MLSNKTAAIEPEITIKSLDALQLSEFYHITAQGETACVHRVIKIDTDNMPENRDKEIIGSIIKDRKNFIEYISFLLGDDFLLSLLENSRLQQSGFYFKKGGMIADDTSAANVLTPKQIKQKRKQQRIFCMNNIVNAKSFDEAIKYKLDLEADGNMADRQIYNELFFKCDDFKTIMELKAEMEVNGLYLDEKLYLRIIKKSLNFQ